MENWTVENFMIVGQAMWKIIGFFWPVIIVAVVLGLAEHRKERSNVSR